MHPQLLSTMGRIVPKIFLISLARIVLSLSSTIAPELSRSLPTNDEHFDYLPNNVIPIAYKIMLHPSFDKRIFEFSGTSEILIQVKKPTTIITLHSSYLNFDSNSSLECDNDMNNIEIAEVKNIFAEELLNITLKTQLPSDTFCKLTLNYNGLGKNYPRGLYRISYVNTKWQRQWIASTNFQPTNARSTFPCWDEPALKAKFSISIKHNKMYVALSNTHAIRHEIYAEDPENIITYFAETPNMSTYAVGFTIGKLDSVDSDPHFRVWIRKNYTKYAKYSTDITQKFVTAMENYTDFSYKNLGFNKLDSIIIPVRGRQITMENWGLINYQQVSMAINENSTSVIRYEHATHTIALKLAYQWFGHLVTPNWYNNLWLSTGIAQYLEYALTDQIEPTWRVMDTFVIDVQSEAFTSDSDMNSPAIEQTKNILKNTKRSNTMKFTTQKSACILRTISYILGEEKLKTALRNYLRIHAFGTVTSSDFFHELAKVEANNKNLTQILRNWVTEPGYPLVNVRRNYKTGKTTITQTRFLYDLYTTLNNKYWIPINFATKNNLDFNDTSVTHWLHPDSDSIEINGFQNDEFVILNKQKFGYYRINYDRRNWELIIYYLRTKSHNDIHVLNRAQLIDDAFNLAKVGVLDYRVFLSIIEYLENEEDYIPWSAAWKGIAHIYKIVKYTDYETVFKRFIEHLSRKLLNAVRLTESIEINSITKLRRISALKNSCFFGSSECRARATSRLYEYLFENKKNTESAEETTWILCEGMRESNETVWNKLWDEYLTNIKADISKIIQPAVGCSSNKTISKIYLSKMLQYNPPYASTFIFFDTVSDSSEIGFETVVEFIIENFEKITTLIGYNPDHIRDYFTSVGSKFKSLSLYNKMSELIAINKIKLNDTAKGLLAAINRNINMVDEPLSQVIYFFKIRDGITNRIRDFYI